MSDSVSGIEYVPENVDNLAAAVNVAITTIGTLLCPPIISRVLTSPPAASDGDCYIPAVGATDDWDGLENYVVRYEGESGSWLAFEPGKVRLAIDMEGSPVSLIFWDGSEWQSV